MDNFAATLANLPPSLNRLVRLLKVFPILASEPVAENKLLSLAIPKISEVGLINLANLSILPGSFAVLMTVSSPVRDATKPAIAGIAKRPRPPKPSPPPFLSLVDGFSGFGSGSPGLFNASRLASSAEARSSCLSFKSESY